MTAASVPTQPPPPAARSGVGRHLRQLGIDTLYLLLGFPLALASFVVLVTGLAMGAGLVITLVGLPILVVALRLAGVFAAVERLQLPAVLGHPVSAPAYRPVPTQEGVLARVLDGLRDRQRWLEVAYGVVRFPVAVVTWCVTVVWWALTLGGLTYPLWSWALPTSPDDQNLADLLGFSGRLADVTLTFGIGLVAALALPWILRACAVGQAVLARELLTAQRAVELQQRVAQLSSSRDATAAAEAGARGRLARDLHDGPQQRLVRVAMDLTAAERSLEADPAGAHGLVAAALAETRATLDELRTLARGVAPAILSDRGLEAALTAVAARSTVPVALAVDVPERLPDAAEQAAYFVVSEALANVAKHADAAHVSVHLTTVDGWLRLEVVDDGGGGAHLAKGHGLAGVADRVAGMEGRLALDSPPGGPTRLSVSLPCG